VRISNREKRFKLTTEHVEYSKYMDLFQEAHTVSMRERERERARERERERALLGAMQSKTVRQAVAL